MSGHPSWLPRSRTVYGNDNDDYDYDNDDDNDSKEDNDNDNKFSFDVSDDVIQFKLKYLP